jgi:Ca-activated chloride channel family protein
VNAFITQFHFLRPEWLLLLVPALIAAIVLFRQTLQRGDWQQHIDEHLRGYMLDNVPGRQSTAGLWAVIVCWILASLAIAGPAWERKAVPVMSNPDALVILMDMSLSMGSQDIAPTRAVRSVRKATDILRGRQDGVTAVIAYAGDAHTVVPFTDDNATIEHLLTSLSPEIMPKPGSRPDKALQLAAKLMTDSGLPKAQILLLTDGIQDKDVARIQATMPASAALSVIAIGTAEGAPVPLGDQGFLKDGSGNIVIPQLNTAPLQSLYSATGSRWRTLTYDDSDWKSLLSGPGPEANVEDERTIVEWSDNGFWLILLILPVALFSFRRGVLFGVALIAVMSLPQPSYAFEFQDLWQTRDQQGQALLESAPEAAAQKFEDPQWRASANYRAGNFEAAAEDFSTSDTATADYNRGNALAQAGRLEDAIEAYETALEKQPEFPQAQQNLDTVKQLKEQQEQQQQDSQNQQNQDSQNQQSQDSQNQQSQDSQNQQNQDSQNQQNQDSQNQQNQDSQNQQSQDSQSQQNQDSQSQQNQDSQSQQNQDSQNQQNQDSQSQQNQKQQDDKYAEEQATQKAQANQDQPSGEEETQSATQQSDTGDNDDTGDQKEQQTRARPADADTMSREERAAMDSLLNQVPDNPGLLMQRKFLYQYRQSGDTSEEDVLW